MSKILSICAGLALLWGLAFATLVGVAPEPDVSGSDVYVVGVVFFAAAFLTALVIAMCYLELKSDRQSV